jgi:uncharacterized membrane protein HdeD (DUF308 family)
MLGLSWGWVVARGIACILLGVLALAWPGVTWMTLVALFAVFALAEGLANIVSAVRGGAAGRPRWWVLLLEGLLSVAAAIVAVMWPRATTLAFVWLLGVWGIVTGVLEIVAAVRLRAIIGREWALGMAGALSIAFGVVLLFRPAAGTLALIWWFGSYALVFGALLVGVGFRLRRFAHHAEPEELRATGT